VLSEIGILFVEGFETTGHTTSWTLFNIATVPGVQDKIAQELDAAGLLAKPGCPPPRELDWEDLKHLPFLTACAKEAMRMLPVVSVMGRATDKDMLVGPYRVPAGTLVGTPLFAIHNTQHNWEQPEQIHAGALASRASRDLCLQRQGAAQRRRSSSSQQQQAGHHLHALQVKDPATCVGQSLAKMEVMTLLAKLCANFTIELTPEMGGRGRREVP